MEKELKEIGSRLKDMREIKGLSVSESSIKINVPSETYESYENGTGGDIPISVLYAAASLYGVELTAILTGEDPKLKIYNVVRKDKRPEVNRRAEYKYENLASNFIHKKVEPLLVTVKPDGRKKEQLKYYSHPGQEFNFVLEGKLLVVINGHEIVLDTGDSLYFDSGYEHAMLALDNKPARFLAVIA